MRFIWSTAVKDWRRHRRDPIGLMMWIGIPLLIGGLITMVAGGKSGPDPKVHMLVIDEDNSIVSGFLIGALSQEAMGGLIETENVAREEGVTRINEGDASALLVIPPGFGQAVIAEAPTSLELLTNPSQNILPRIAQETMSILVDASFYLHRVLGDDIRDVASNSRPDQNAFSQSQIAELASRVNNMQARLGTYLFPPVIRIENVVEEEDESDGVSLALLFVPGMLFMSLLFMAQGISMDLWREHDNKTLRRVVSTPHQVTTFLTGKLLGGAGVMFLVIFITMNIAYLYFQLNIATLPAALIWTVLSGLFLMLMMLTIQVHAPSERAGGILTMAIMFPLMMIGGSFFPFETMGSTMAFFGRLTPNGWALEQLKRILLNKVDVQSLGVSLIGLIVIGVGLFVVSARRIKSAFVQG